MDIKVFKNTLMKALEMHYDDIGIMDDFMIKVMETLPGCDLYIEETGTFSSRDWNTYQSVLHIRVPLDAQNAFENEKSEIYKQADRIYGRQGDHYLDALKIDILLEFSDIVNLQHMASGDIVSRAIEDAEASMKKGEYDSAFDRVHTALHGYVRGRLTDLGVVYSETDNLVQLYSKLYSEVE